MKIEMHRSDDSKQLNWHLNANRKKRSSNKVTYINFSFRMILCQPEFVELGNFIIHIHSLVSILAVIYFSYSFFPSFTLSMYVFYTEYFLAPITKYKRIGDD